MEKKNRLTLKTRKEKKDEKKQGRTKERKRKEEAIIKTAKWG